MKKLVVLLLVLLVLAIAIGLSPIVDYIHANAAEETGSLPASDSSLTAAVTTSDSLAYSPESHRNAIVFALIMAGGTVFVSVLVFIKRHDPNK